VPRRILGTVYRVRYKKKGHSREAYLSDYGSIFSTDEERQPETSRSERIPVAWGDLPERVRERLLERTERDQIKRVVRGKIFGIPIYEATILKEGNLGRRVTGEA
jgi:hypothetical protein